MIWRRSRWYGSPPRIIGDDPRPGELGERRLLENGATNVQCDPLAQIWEGACQAWYAIGCPTLISGIIADDVHPLGTEPSRRHSLPAKLVWGKAQIGL